VVEVITMDRSPRADICEAHGHDVSDYICHGTAGHERGVAVIPMDVAGRHVGEGPSAHHNRTVRGPRLMLRPKPARSIVRSTRHPGTGRLRGDMDNPSVAENHLAVAFLPLSGAHQSNSATARRASRFSSGKPMDIRAHRSSGENARPISIPLARSAAANSW
jgi:hypothetical protein